MMTASERDEIVAYASLEEHLRPGVDAQIDAIFFEASSVKSFRDDAHRQAFRWLWLGRYLVDEPEHAFIAMREGRVVGYLVGSLDDPAPRPEFAELTYFHDFADQTSRFPAHLHVNVACEARGRGVGARLVRRFEQHAEAQGVPGVHVVTGDGVRNVGFYERLGYREVARTGSAAKVVVMLALRVIG